MSTSNITFQHDIKPHFAFLDTYLLNKSAFNMFDGIGLLSEQFWLSKKEARQIFSQWAVTLGQRAKEVAKVDIQALKQIG